MKHWAPAWQSACCPLYWNESFDVIHINQDEFVLGCMLSKGFEKIYHTRES